MTVPQSLQQVFHLSLKIELPHYCAMFEELLEVKVKKKMSVVSKPRWLKQKPVCFLKVQTKDKIRLLKLFSSITVGFL